MLHFVGIPVHAVGGGGFVHEFVEGEVVDGGYFVFGPVVSDAGGRVAHRAGFFGGVECITFAIVVGELDGGWFWWCLCG